MDPRCMWSLLFYSWMWSFVRASRRLHTCFQNIDLTDNETTSTTINMPPILHFQTWSRDPHDPLVMNYAWSTVGYPTLFISQSFGAKNCTNQAFHANMTEYEDSQSYGSVYVAGSESDSAVAIVFRRIIEFDGGKKSRASGAFNSSEAANDSSTEYYSTYLDDSSMKWYYDPEDRKITGKSDTFKSLIFSFVLPYKEGSGRLSYFPKTSYTVNSTVVDVTLLSYNFSMDQDVNGTPVTKNGRIAMEMVMIGGQKVNRSSTSVTSYVDDEYTPSVFRTWQYFFDPRRWIYLQWKPISYQTHNRKSTQSQEANLVYPEGAAVDILGGEVPRGLASALFNESSMVLNGTAFYMVIGTAGDDNYVNPFRVTWTAVLGFGEVPQDHISLEVIIIIIVSLGIPALLILLGSFYVTYKNKPWQSITKRLNRGSYERIN